ncbi:MAG: Si-specific NAD(P)(+) transhydrogenase [Deltaproteobacteria bacterium]|nr:Si-specific NAD(P)(+) transhydrogenase [Deltaproteobacteria bacterium]
MINQYDIVIIGSGPAGEKAAMEATRLGASVAVIEKEFQPGGASVISGTIPSKSIRETVQYVDLLTHDEISGLKAHLDNPISIKELMYRKNKVVEQRVEDIYSRYAKSGIDYINGVAEFIGPHKISVILCKTEEKITLTAKKTIIAVGTKPYHPDDVIFDGKLILDSDTILKLDFVPDEIAIYGGGVIGCEYASIFSKLGTKVTLIDPRERLLDFIDQEVSEYLTEKMRESNVELKLNQQYKTIRLVNDQVHILFGSGEKMITPCLFYANGRQGLADLLNLEAVGLKANKRSQLDVNQNYQTQIPHIYGVGDVIGFPSLVSVSNEEGRLAARNAVLGQDVYRISGVIPYGIYTIPEIATIGPTEYQLKEKGVDYVAGKSQFDELARAMIIGRKEGFLKILFDRDSKRLLATHIIGHLASELVHIAQAVIHYRGTVDFFAESVINFPSLSSAYKNATIEALEKIGGNA